VFRWRRGLFKGRGALGVVLSGSVVILSVMA